MKKLFSTVVAACLSLAAVPVLAQCSNCAGGAPAFQSYSAPANYSAPIGYSAPINYAAPISYAAPINCATTSAYAASAPIGYATPILYSDAGCTTPITYTHGYAIPTHATGSGCCGFQPMPIVSQPGCGCCRCAQPVYGCGQPVIAGCNPCAAGYGFGGMIIDGGAGVIGQPVIGQPATDSGVISSPTEETSEPPSPDPVVEPKTNAEPAKTDGET